MATDALVPNFLDAGERVVESISAVEEEELYHQLDLWAKVHPGFRYNVEESFAGLVVRWRTRR